MKHTKKSRWPKPDRVSAAPTTKALVPVGEQAQLVALLHRQRRERLALAEQQEEMRRTFETAATRDRKDLEARHVREWFEHRQRHGHELGPAALRFMGEGRA